MRCSGILQTMNDASGNHDASARPRLFRARGLLLLALALLLCVGGTLALYGRELATGFVRAALTHFGAPPDELELRAVGLDQLVIGAIRLPGGLSASAVEIGWSPRSLLHGRLTNIRILGLAAGLTFDRGQITVDGLPRDGRASGIPRLPFDSLELSDARLAITSGAASIDIQGDATIKATDLGIQGQAAFDATATLNDGSQAHIEVRAPQWSLGPDAGGMRIVFSGAAATLPEHRLSATDIDVAVGMTESAAASIRLSAKVSDSAMPVRFASFALIAQGERDRNALVASGRITAGRGFVLAFDGRHDLASGDASVDLETEPVRFQPDGLQPDDLLPVIGRTPHRVEGAISARGTLSWRGSLEGDVAVRLDGVGFETGIARIGDLDATLRLDSIMPPRTPGAQHITGTLQVAGLPTAPLDLRLGLPGDNRLVVSSATLGLAGGTIGLGDLAVALGQPVETALELRSIDLGAMLALSGIDGLSGSGVIEGRIPVRMDDAGFVIASGRLASTGPGIVRYTGAGLPEGVTAGHDDAGDAVRLLRQALADFHYADLSLTLDRSASGEGSLLVSLRGANPAVLDNHPFDINIRLEANFDQLAAVLLNGYAAADGLLRRVTPQ